MKSRICVPARFPFSGAAFRIALLVLTLVAGLSSVSLYAEPSASALYKQGLAAEAREDYDAAYNFYQKAYAKSPKEIKYRESYYRVKVPASSQHMSKGRKLLLAGDEQGALMEFLHASEIDPGNEAAQQEIVRIRNRQGEAPAAETSLPEEARAREEIDAMGSPTALKPLSNEPLTLHMTEDAKVVYQAIGRAAGINVLFDPDYTSKRIQVDLNSVSLMDALRIVGTMSNTFWRPVTSNSIFVAQNTRAKRTELDEQAVQTFYLSNAWQQNDLNDVQTALRNVLPNAKVYGVASQNAIVMRGTPDELLLAQKLVDDLDKARPEVVVDIAVLEVSKLWERNIGLTWPSSVGVALQPATTSTTSSSTCTTGSTDCSSTSTNLTLSNLAHLNSNNFAVTIGAATANLLLSDSNTKILQNPRIRATDQQKATMKIGSRIPIATGSYQTGAATTAVSSLVNTQFQYLDVGVNIEVTPTVHFNRDVTLKTKIEVTSQAGQSTISGVTEPIIAQKTSEQTVRLREGEANILGGILNQQDQVAWSGIPGLSSIPILRYVFGSKDHTINDDEIVFLMIPHVVRSQVLDPVNLRTIDTGVGQAIELRRIASDNPAPVQRPMMPRPAATQPMVGTVPGQTAQAALPAALAQLRNAATTDPTAQAAAPQAPSMPTQQPALSGQPGVSGQAAAAPGAPGQISFALTPPATPIAAGTTFQVPVILNGGVNVASVPLQIKYDPAVLTLVGVAQGDLLGRDGQSVALAHRDDASGLITLNSSRPPGTAGVSGSGSVCVLTFQAKTAGTTTLDITHPGAMNPEQQPLPAQGARVSLQVR